jgi:hypothetical protein
MIEQFFTFHFSLIYEPELCIRANKVLIWVNNSGHCAK